MKAIPLLLASALNPLLTYFLLALRRIFLVFSYSAAPLRFFVCFQVVFVVFRFPAVGVDGIININ